MNTVKQAQGLLVELLGDRQYEQQSLAASVPPGEAIKRISVIGDRVIVTFGDGTRIAYRTIVSPAPEGAGK